ncbi:MAG: hypothetical protein N3F63_07510 [Thermoplasmata archaeon]|nr:hypothetical protein [Thermoplasmata archaeon]
METRTQFIALIVILAVLICGVAGYYLYKDWSTPKEVTKHYSVTNTSISPKSDIVLEFYSKAGGNITGTINATSEVEVSIFDTLNYLEYRKDRNLSAVRPVFTTNGTKINLAWNVPSENFWYLFIYNNGTESVVVEYDVWCRFLS